MTDLAARILHEAAGGDIAEKPAGGSPSPNGAATGPHAYPANCGRPGLTTSKQPPASSSPTGKPPEQDV